MFGESDSESPRVPSPWDSLASSPSPPKHNKIHTIPKLVPEVEEGNVEYKLQLLSPTPARFARLVTQLKWRLLEGGGQAYYELGVADSGTLVGLPREQLEESLETLEMMAGEIGASVIVVKEIEVPPELSSLAESQLERWNGRRSMRRKDLLRMVKQDASPTASVVEVDAELSSTDLTDTEESTCPSPATPPALFGDSVQSRPCPTSFPLDSSLAMFTMDVGEDIANYADSEAPNSEVSTDFVSEFTAGLEISSVYKPRPMKKHATHVAPTPTHSEYMKVFKNGCPLPRSTDATRFTGDSIVRDLVPVFSQPKETKARSRRDKRRELKRDVSPAPRDLTGSPTNSPDPPTVPTCSTDDLNPSVSESLHINVVDVCSGDASGTTPIATKEPRLIVEALVVRKLSLEEVFLDFELFSLQ